MSDLFDGLGAALTLGLDAETVTYTKKNGTVLSLSAIVHRPPRSTGNLGGDLQYMVYKREVTIPASTSLGTPNRGGDTVGLKSDVGDASNTTYNVVDILSQDGGVWRLGLN